ncbi:hypothetical protein O7599_27785 [Streptomyces sp. WMMC500]|uniref:hypothetical protein n=1 Tax=Streptomyces sp. WMMC500 TaxID=3015154 RepID=UPI00248BB8F4|nr:hypothetical protein [Streptomyces sp. WMMC500]WBB59347.1 hypothetical protein O7599_27785 [Streptomyces sp. WMMC500]
MEEIAAALRLELPERRIVTDPRNVTAPCVLINPPTIQDPHTLCGGFRYQFEVLVIGLAGAGAELHVLAELLAEVLDVLPITLAEPVPVEIGPASGTDPNQGYRLTTNWME